MKRNVGEMWKIKEGSKTYWYVQFPNGRICFNTKKVAIKWQEQLLKDSKTEIH